jgi:hypothetical protein
MTVLRNNTVSVYRQWTAAEPAESSPSSRTTEEETSLAQNIKEERSSGYYNRSVQKQQDTKKD